jgi:hypothetical protein
LLVSGFHNGRRATGACRSAASLAYILFAAVLYICYRQQHHILVLRRAARRGGAALRSRLAQQRRDALFGTLFTCLSA